MIVHGWWWLTTIVQQPSLRLIITWQMNEPSLWYSIANCYAKLTLTNLSPLVILLVITIMICCNMGMFGQSICAYLCCCRAFWVSNIVGLQPIMFDGLARLVILACTPFVLHARHSGNLWYMSLCHDAQAAINRLFIPRSMHIVLKNQLEFLPPNSWVVWSNCCIHYFIPPNS